MKYSEKIQRIKNLIKEMNTYRDSYYNESKSLISDYEYDKLFDELVALEKETGIILSNSPTQSVGYEVKSELVKVTHSHPMLSLKKTKLVNDLVKFSNGKNCVISLKMDGLTILNSYDNGKLIQSETRGNGEVGENVTHNAKVFTNLPLEIPFDRKFEIEGEAIITYEDFEKINASIPNKEDKYKNPRNLASGSVRQLDSNIAESRHIRFVAWKVPFGVDSYAEGFEMAEKLGFEVVPYVKYNSKFDDVEKAIETLKQIAKEKSFPVDGLVICYDNIEYGKSLGMTGHHPRHSLAFKFYDEDESTVLRGIEWTMGKTGTLTPVAIFDEIELDGTIVSRASLHNITICKELKLGIGDEITVYKANSIIPQVRENLTESNTFEIPSICPICGAKTSIIKDNDSEVLICTNDDCKGKLLGKLSHFVSRDAMNIDGLSDSKLTKFIELGWVDRFEDIYTLEERGCLNDLCHMRGFGVSSVAKLAKAISKSRTTTLDKFLYALSIPLVGKSTAKDIANFVIKEANEKDYGGCGYGHIWSYFIETVTYEDSKYWMQIDGIGDIVADSIVKYFKEKLEEVDSLAQCLIFEVPEEKAVVVTDDIKNLSGITFCITGSLEHFKNRNECVETIERLGGKVVSSISKNTSYLVNNDINSTSSKNKKAKSLNIPIINEKTLLSMVM